MVNFNISPIMFKNVLRGSYSKHTMNDKVTHINTKDKKLKIHSVKKLYHGTNTLYDTVDLNLCQPFKDFGVGYYLTTDKAQAQKWAQHKANHSDIAYIYSYSIRKPFDADLRVREFLKYDKDWVDFITANRTGLIDEKYDIVYDRIADNNWQNITQILTSYKAGQMDADEVIRHLQKRDTSADQYCFKTANALSILENPRRFFLRRNSKGKWNAPIELKGEKNE